MDIKRLVTGTVVGGILVYALGYLIFDTAFRDFYAANAGSATGIDRAEPVMWAVIVGSLMYAALITLGLGSRSGAAMGSGITVGAVVGFLLWGTADFTLYGITNLSNLTRTIVDPLLEAVRGGITGGVIALVLAKMR